MSNETQFRRFCEVRPVQRDNWRRLQKFEPIRPSIVGYYSILPNRKYEDSGRNLLYFRKPQPSELPLDLNTGIDRVITKNISSERMYQMLSYILAHKADVGVANAAGEWRLPYDIVTFRGVLRLIMCTYTDNNCWTMQASRYKGTTYIYRVEVPQPGYSPQLHWGFKFEQHCLVDEPNAMPRTDDPVDECPEFGCVFRTDLGAGLKLLYAAEMDGVISDSKITLNETKDLSSIRFIEVKSVAVNTKKQEYCFDKYKSLNWWCQSHLVGTEQICAGFHDGKGNTQRIEMLNVEDLWMKKPWRREAAVDFLKLFLSRVQKYLQHADSPTTVFEFQYDGQNINYRAIENNKDVAFLEDWYIAGLKS